MKRIHKTFSLPLIVLLGSLVGMATAQQGENSAQITLEGPALNGPMILQTQTTLPIQEGTLIDGTEPGSIVLPSPSSVVESEFFQSENPFDVAPGQFDEAQQRIPSQSSPAATIPPTLNPPRSSTETNPFLSAPTLTAPRIQNYGVERVPRCSPGAASCAYERERALRDAYLAPPTGYVPYGGLGIDRQYDYHRAGRYDYDHDRRASYDYYPWMNRFPPSPYRPCPYAGCPNGFGY